MGRAEDFDIEAVFLVEAQGVAGDDLTGTMENLFDIATKHGAPVEALGVLYGRLALVQRESRAFPGPYPSHR